MNTDISYVTDTPSIVKLATAIMGGINRLGEDRATYLRSLLAGTQERLVGKPILRLAGRAKRVEVDRALEAFELTNSAFYDAVLSAVPADATSDDRQSRTSFARSAASTLRRAIKTGWNPLGTNVSNVTKGALAAWTAEHSVPKPLTAVQVEKRVVGLAERIRELLGRIPADERLRLQETVAEAMGERTRRRVETPQRITGMRLTKTERPRAAAH